MAEQLNDKDEQADYNIEIVITLRFGQLVNERKIPATEINSYRDCRDTTTIAAYSAMKKSDQRKPEYSV